MNRPRAARSGAAVLLTALLMTAAAVLPHAQRRRPDNSVHGLPVATNTLFASPDVYLGKLVTVSASVEQVLSDIAFVVDQRRVESATAVAWIGKPLLVIAPGLSRPVTANRAFLVRGEFTRFGPDALRAGTEQAVGLPADVAAEYAGRPVLIATSVIDSNYAELVKGVDAAQPKQAPAAP